MRDPATKFEAATAANAIERAMVIAAWTEGKDAEFQFQRATKAFRELASILGYRVEKIEAPVYPDFQGEPPALQSALIVRGANLQAAE